jgi:hypothetical protein
MNRPLRPSFAFSQDLSRFLQLLVCKKLSLL